MGNDLLIKNGLIVDGTGAEPRHGDVAVRDGKITQIGKVNGSADRTVDAGGLAVAPGFWDVHTHYDAQFVWDPIATSSSWHGITTVMMGNCGFTLAPCRPDKQEWLVKTLSRVEGMNVDVLKQTLPWSWETYPQYLDLLEPGLGINAMTMAGHTTIRRYVMGEDGSEREATEAELVRMKQVLAECLDAGAFGFSTSRVVTHADGDGNPVPSRVCPLSETMDMASVLKGRNIGYVQLAVGHDFNKYSEEGRARLAEIARSSRGHICINGVAQNTTNRTGWKDILGWMEGLRAEGTTVFGLGHVLNGHNQFNLDFTNVFDRFPLWTQTLIQPMEERVRLLNNPEMRDRLLDAFENTGDSFFNQNPLTWERMVLVKTQQEAVKRFEGQGLVQIAAALGKRPIDALLDISLGEGLQAQFHVLDSRNPEESAQEAILKAPHILPEQSDAGAHMVTEVGTGFPTHLLGYWVREKGAMSLQEAVWRLSALQAREIGVTDRGTIEEGMAGDFVVFDPETVGTSERVFANDLPGDSPRLVQYAKGIEYTIVNGHVTLEQGKYSGAAGGRFLRSRDYV